MQAWKMMMIVANFLAWIQVHQDAYPQSQSILQIKYTVSTVNQQTHLAEFPQIDSGIAVPVFKQGDDPINAINKMMSFLSTVVTSRFPFINNQLRNSSNPRQQSTIQDGRVTVQSVQGRHNSFAAGISGTWANISETGGNNSDDLDAYDSDCDDFSIAKAVLMTNFSSYGSNVLSEIRPMLYDGSIIAKETNVISIADSEETLMLEEESQSKMLLKQSDPVVLKQKFNIKPIIYAKLNRLFKDFGKRFVPQQELSNEQALHPNNDQSASSPVKIEAPRELSKVNLVNKSLKKLKYHLGQFDNVVKKRITPDALTKGE
nr:hypothetical protein [Tanacetum cinerariifolium]